MYIENNDIFVKDFFLIFFFLKFIDYSLEVIARAFMIFSMPLLPRVTTIISLRKYVAGKKIQQSTKELIVWSDRDELLALYNPPLVIQAHEIHFDPITMHLLIAVSSASLICSPPLLCPLLYWAICKSETLLLFYYTIATKLCVQWKSEKKIQ